MNTPAVAPSLAPRRRSGWWFLAKWSGGLVVVAVLTLTLWLHSRGDLLAVREQVAAAGFPTSGSEMGRKRSAEERCRLRERLAVVVNDLNMSAYFNIPKNFGIPGTPLPETYHAHMAALPRARLSEMGTLLDALGDEPVILEENLTMATQGEGIRPLSLLHLQALGAPREELPVLLKRLLQSAQRSPPVARADRDVRATALYKLIQVLLYRLADLERELRRDYADHLLTLVDDPGAQLAGAQVGDLVKHLDFFDDPDERIRSSGLTMLDFYRWPVIGSLVMRGGRGGFLVRELEWAGFLRDHRNDLRAVRAEAKLRYDYPRPIPWTEMAKPSLWVGHSLNEWARGWEVDHTIRLWLRAQLVAAVLREEPWPVDWFDPAGGIMRPILVEGVVRGAYSVGPDGRGDGGNRRTDTCWPLFGPLDPLAP